MNKKNREFSKNILTHKNINVNIKLHYEKGEKHVQIKRRLFRLF
jgi:hypothetical protein